MYLQGFWVDHIKQLYSRAHKGNVSSLLEAFNRVAKVGYTFSYTRSEVDNCTYLLCEIDGAITRHVMDVLKPDEGAVSLTCFLNKLSSQLEH